MKIIIEADAKEIADLAFEIQDRLKEKNKRKIKFSYDPLEAIKNKLGQKQEEVCL